jgi:hypothetical protein
MVPVPTFAHHHLLVIWDVGSGLEASLEHEKFNKSISITKNEPLIFIVIMVKIVIV